MKTTIPIPAMGIVLMVGPSNCGKTTLLDRLVGTGVIERTQIVSSDQFRELLDDRSFIDWRGKSKTDADLLYHEYQVVSREAFELMEKIIGARSRLGKLTFVDATHLHAEEREKYIQLGRRHHVPVMAIALDIEEKELLTRDSQREHPRGRGRVKQQVQVFRQNKRLLKSEGFRAVYTLQERDLEKLEFVRKENPLILEMGPGIDVIGDVHGCFDELIELLEKLGYASDEQGLYRHPEGRIFVSVGDVMSRGPQSIACMRFMKKHVEAGCARMVDSNHGWKIARWLDGKQVQLAHGDERIQEEFENFAQQHGGQAAEDLKQQLKMFLLEAPAHLVFQKEGAGRVVVTHAGIKDHYIGKESKRIRDYCRYGESAGLDAEGKPIRHDWFVHHQSKELIVWGHDPKKQPLFANNTVNIDQGVVFGGSLTALRLPEKEIVQVEAKENYTHEAGPFEKWEKERFALPNLAKYRNGFVVQSKWAGDIAVREESVMAAIDTVSHYTVPIEELIYIPPTMSPAPGAASQEDFLEHPAEAFSYYRSQGIPRMIVEKKHMGSRGVVLLFRSEEAAVPYLGYPSLGTIYTRTGRAFFSAEKQAHILRQLNEDLTNGGYFEKYQTDLLLLDTEIMPWNLKAKELISTQYAHVAEAAILDRKHTLRMLQKAANRHQQLDEWLEEGRQKQQSAQLFSEVFQNYCWDAPELSHIQIAPFHILAHSKQSQFHQSHLWHLGHVQELAQLSSLIVETQYRVVEDEQSEEEAVRWWLEMTEDGHEGVVVKPDIFMTTDNQERLVQPALKVRGRKYLHIIYGMDYLRPENLSRLKQRSTSKKQRNALREFALGIESVNRFIQKQPLDSMHEAVLATLALESDPIDPRL